MQAGLRAALATYQDELVSADVTAAKLARNPAFQRALLSRDRAALQRLLASRPHLSVEGNGFRVGRPDPMAATRQVEVLGADGTRAEVVAAVPLDQKLVNRLEARSGLEVDEHSVLIEDRRIIAGPGNTLGDRFNALPGKTHTLTLSGTRYRTLPISWWKVADGWSLWTNPAAARSHQAPSALCPAPKTSLPGAVNERSR